MYTDGNLLTAGEKTRLEQLCERPASTNDVGEWEYTGLRQWHVQRALDRW